jgi:hypothetical protein
VRVYLEDLVVVDFRAEPHRVFIVASAQAAPRGLAAHGRSSRDGDEARPQVPRFIPSGLVERRSLMIKLLAALIAVAAVAIAATAAFACNDGVYTPPPQVQAPPDGGSGS